MPRNIPFLEPTVNQIRKSIRDIDDSYNNDWDILAELAQNSIDSIKDKIKNDSNFIGKIDIIIDIPRNRIVFQDNGMGIEKENLLKVIKPFTTYKENESDSIGEKGVGLTFVLFSCNNFRIKSGYNNCVREVKIIDASLWKEASSDELLSLEHEDLNEDFEGTLIEIIDIKGTNILDLNIKQLEYVLRTRTAIGNTKSIWENNINIDINLIYISAGGETLEKKIPFEYLTPLEIVSENEKLDLDAFEMWLKSRDRSDSDKRNKLRDKLIYKKGKFIHSDNREINYLAIFVPKRSTWTTLSINDTLYDDNLNNNNDWRSNFCYIGYTAGIYTSVKGMPTGITIEPPQSGAAGYWNNLFIIMQDNKLKFDIGRKSLHGSQVRVLRSYAKDIFNIFNKYSKYISGDVSSRDPWERDEIFSEIEGLLSLENSKTKFSKVPTSQEASVAAIFFELLGNGTINNINPLACGYKNKYDLYALWGRRKLVVEFKSSLKNIFKDFRDLTKMFDEMNCIVCWDVNEEDLVEVQNKGLRIEEIQRNGGVLINQNNNDFPEATHKLVLNEYVNSIYIIDLKKLINRQ